MNDTDKNSQDLRELLEIINNKLNQLIANDKMISFRSEWIKDQLSLINAKLNKTIESAQQ